jgi:hypothetical protein
MRAALATDLCRIVEWIEKKKAGLRILAMNLDTGTEQDTLLQVV